VFSFFDSYRNCVNRYLHNFCVDIFSGSVNHSTIMVYNMHRSGSPVSYHKHQQEFQRRSTTEDDIDTISWETEINQLFTQMSGC